MSIRWLTYVFDHSRTSGAARLVLATIAFRAGDDGRCWPGIDDIARRANMPVRSAWRAIAELVESGELVIETRGGGGRKTNTYRIVNLSGTVTPCHCPNSDVATLSTGGTVTRRDRDSDVTSVDSVATSPESSLKTNESPPPPPEPRQEPKVVVVDGGGANADADARIAALRRVGIVDAGVIRELAAMPAVTTERIRVFAAYAERNGLRAGWIAQELRSGREGPPDDEQRDAAIYAGGTSAVEAEAAAKRRREGDANARGDIEAARRTVDDIPPDQLAGILETVRVGMLSKPPAVPDNWRWIPAWLYAVLAAWSPPASAEIIRPANGQLAAWLSEPERREINSSKNLSQSH